MKTFLLISLLFFSSCQPDYFNLYKIKITYCDGKDKDSIYTYDFKPLTNDNISYGRTVYIGNSYKESKRRYIKYDKPIVNILDTTFHNKIFDNVCNVESFLIKKKAKFNLGWGTPK